jgi:hypothetical protein
LLKRIWETVPESSIAESVRITLIEVVVTAPLLITTVPVGVELSGIIVSM